MEEFREISTQELKKIARKPGVPLRYERDRASLDEGTGSPI